MPNGPTTSTTVCYLGQLFQTARRPNTTLRLLGGIHGSIQMTNGIEFPVGVYYNLRNPSQPARLEGAAAPTPEHRVVTQSTNVVQIFHEAVEATYLGQSDNTMSGPIAIPLGAAQGQPVNPRSPEWQIMQSLETIAQDANYSFLRGTYAKPADPTSAALKTRGILTALTTNVFDQSADAVSATPGKQIRGYVNKLLKAVVDSNGYNPDMTWVLMADSTTYGNIIAAYEELPANRTPESVSVAGLKIRTIYTRYGALMIVMEPDAEANEFSILNFAVAGIVGLQVPGKEGILFEEVLAKTGSKESTQIYGQLGVDHGPEYCHGKLKMPAGLNP